MSAISETVGSKVYVGKEKMGLMHCLEWEQLARALTLDPHGAHVHVLSIGELTLDVSWIPGPSHQCSTTPITRFVYSSFFPLSPSRTCPAI